MAAWTWASANIEAPTSYGGNPKWALLPRAIGCSIVNVSCPDAHVGSGSYGCNLEQVGCGASSWTISAGTLSPWASITSDTGVIFGSPSGSSPSTAMFTAAYDTATQPLTITTCTLPSITTASPLTDAVQNQAYTPVQLTSTGDNSGTCSGCTWGATGVPSGMTFTTGGVLSGTPTGITTATITATATNACGNNTKALSLNIIPSASSTCPVGTVCAVGAVSVQGGVKVK